MSAPIVTVALQLVVRLAAFENMVGLTATPQNAIGNALDGGTRRDTGANNRLSDVRVRKMRRNQRKPRTGKISRALRHRDVIHGY